MGPRRLLRLATILAVAIAGAAVSPAAAQGAHPIRLQPFAADSGDRCPYGVTAGQLAFRAVHPPELPAVDIWGKVLDRPDTAEPTVCPDDGWYTIAVFTGLANIAVVDRETVRVNNATVEFRITLGNDPTISRLDGVEVQVCRTPVFGPAVIRCGKPQHFKP